jgi:cytochrome b subunit of formate dehydrogenase
MPFFGGGKQMPRQGSQNRGGLIRDITRPTSAAPRAAASSARPSPLALRPAPAILALAALLLLFPAYAHALEVSPTELANRRCFNCHGQQRIANLSPAERAAMLDATARPEDLSTTTDPRPDLYVSAQATAGSMHEGLACISCHADAEALPHARDLKPAQCDQACHVGAAVQFRRGVHAAALARNDELAPTCATCHGGHQILPSNNRQSQTYPLNVVKICADCHEQHYSQTTNGRNEKEHVESYMESVHGKAVTEAGLIVAATCVSCHGSHDVLPSTDPRSAVSRQHVPRTCGKCHLGVTETYEQSVHGRQLAAGDENAPVCTDCHAAHAISRAGTPQFALDIAAECGQCHDQPRPGGGRSLYTTYRLSYHGQVTELGSTRAARCSDCHGAHDIQPVASTDSRLHESNRVRACQQCHPGANASFAQFQPHADYLDGRRYPLLHGVWLYFIILMSATFSFFGLHSVLWFFRSIKERLRNGPTPRHTANPHGIRRFKRIDRVNHALVIISFFGLTLTGMPLLFSDQAWAKNLSAMMGGGHGAGIFHRIFAVMLIINVAIHAGGVIRRIRATSLKAMLLGPNSMLPNFKDAKDCLGMFRWFLVGGKKPSFDRWTYWEKFDYWAEIVGTGIIGGSGLMLWFPTFFSNFLPGWLFNIATIIHGYEAMLAVGFIFTIHFFNAHLRLEKFPVDDVIFTGQLPEEEFRHERATEYARLQANGQLDALRVPPAPRWYRPLAIVAGLLAMAVGTTIVLFIIFAGLASL